jgi:hypothetical protein
MADNVKIIDPVEFFAFMDGYNDYPTNGYRLSEAARARGYSSDLVNFLAGMPGQFANEADVLPLAERVDEPPRGQVLAVEQSGAEPPIDGPTVDLTIDDITRGGS